MAEHVAGREARLKTSPYEFIDEATSDLREAFRSKRGFAEPDPASVERIFDNYALSLRGKTLVDVLAKFTAHKSRAEKYGADWLIDLCLRLYAKTNPHVARILVEARIRLA